MIDLTRENIMIELTKKYVTEDCNAVVLYEIFKDIVYGRIEIYSGIWISEHWSSECGMNHNPVYDLIEKIS